MICLSVSLLPLSSSRRLCKTPPPEPTTMSLSLSNSFRRYLRPDIHHHHHNLHLQLRTFIDGVEFNFVRDRGLDHAVEREKNLQPLMNLKNLIKSEPSKSLPLSTIADHKEKLRIPLRPIEFVRKYPSVFEEYFPGNIRIHPHVRLTGEALELDSDEQLIYQSDTFRRGAADRLIKLLMLCRVNEIPLGLIDRLKWDLGIPDDYVKTLVPEFPHYFQVRSTKGSRFGEGFLELVCWDSKLAVSAMEKKAVKGNSVYQKGMPVEFPLQYSTGFEMDKRLKKWVDEWQKLPYVSPYENALHLQPKSDESDRWAVGVLHEFLHILVSKKMERDNILCLGEYLGTRSRFRGAFVQHPGIFYLSSKSGTHTVVLREGFKRGLLIEKNALMEMRSRYIHLMNKGKDVEKPKNGVSPNKTQKLKEPEREEERNVDGGEERDEIQSSEGESESDDQDYSEDEVKESARKVVAVVGRRRSGGRNNDRREPRRRSDKRRSRFTEAI